MSKITLESIGENEVRLYRSDRSEYDYLVYVTPGHAGKFADAVNNAIQDSAKELQTQLADLKAKHEGLEDFVRSLTYWSNKGYFGELRERGDVFCVYDQDSLENKGTGTTALDAYYKWKEQQ